MPKVLMLNPFVPLTLSDIAHQSNQPKDQSSYLFTYQPWVAQPTCAIPKTSCPVTPPKVASSLLRSLRASRRPGSWQSTCEKKNTWWTRTGKWGWNEKGKNGKWIQYKYINMCIYTIIYIYVYILILFDHIQYTSIRKGWYENSLGKECKQEKYRKYTCTGLQGKQVWKVRILPINPKSISPEQLGTEI